MRNVFAGRRAQHGRESCQFHKQRVHLLHTLQLIKYEHTINYDLMPPELVDQIRVFFFFFSGEYIIPASFIDSIPCANNLYGESTIAITRAQKAILDFFGICWYYDAI